MMLSPCQSLEDYLARNLTGAAGARFLAHLANCPECRRAVQEHQQLVSLLADAVARLEPGPPGLTERVERRLRTARRRRVAIVAAALAAMVAAIWLLGRDSSRPANPDPALAKGQPEPPALATAPPVKPVRVTFPPGANVIVVPEKTESANVTFLWVYHGRRTTSGPAPAAANPPSIPERSDP
jgi:anti-sigma factor RsiW